jgi:hypothetical protein
LGNQTHHTYKILANDSQQQKPSDTASKTSTTSTTPHLCDKMRRATPSIGGAKDYRRGAARQAKSAASRKREQMAAARVAKAAQSASSQGGVRRLRSSNSNRRGAKSKRHGDDSDSDDDDSTSDNGDSSSSGTPSSSEDEDAHVASSSPTRSAAAAADAKVEKGTLASKSSPFSIQYSLAERERFMNRPFHDIGSALEKVQRLAAAKAMFRFTHMKLPLSRQCRLYS